MVNYYLMHKNIRCGEIAYDETTGRITKYKNYPIGASPFWGTADISKIKKWWEIRAVPASRHMMQDLIKKQGFLNAGAYLAKNLALSMTDTYWICPENMNLNYDDVKFINFAVYNSGRIPYHNATSYDPNASLGGQMEKYWDLSGSHPVLVKESYKYFGQQAVNEVFATFIHEKQDAGIPYVPYFAVKTEDNGILCKCSSFTNEHAELISAYEMVESVKQKSNVSSYDTFIQACVSHGMDPDAIQTFMDYQTLTDFIISNEDEHLLNFGVLRNPDTMELIGPAPIFDSGNSMFFSDMKKIPDTRIQILERKITGFYKSEEQMLKKVHDKHIVRADLLPSPYETFAFYAEAGLPEWKASIIGQNYATKVEMLNEFQHGKSISLYQEKEKKINYAKQMDKPAFIMMCGLPHSDNTGKAKNIIQSLSGYTEIKPEQLCSVEEVYKNAGRFLNRKKALAAACPVPVIGKSCVYISFETIRKEVMEHQVPENDDFVSLVADVRIRTALLSGIHVVFDTMNLDRHMREKYIGLAETSGAGEKTIYFMEDTVGSDYFESMSDWLKSDRPDTSEGWDNIVKDTLYEHNIDGDTSL